MTEAHELTQAEREQLFTDDEPLVNRPPLHHRSVCVCADPEAIVVDLVWGSGLSPQRTETACNAVVCTANCTAWVEGHLINGQPSCAVCTHTAQSHKPRKAVRKAKRNG